MTAVLRIDPTSPAPPYEQLRLQLIDQITAGVLPPGSRLPSVRTLAGELGLAPNTVARTYRELEAARFVTTAGRNGTVVAEFGNDDAKARTTVDGFVTAMQRLGFGPEAIVALVQQRLADRRPTS